MKSNGIEYKIYRNGTGKKFKVMIKGPGFMGFERWKWLYKEWYKRDLRGGSDWYTTSPHECGDSFYRVYYSCLAVFDSCKKAKEAAIEYSEYHLEDKWEECRC